MPKYLISPCRISLVSAYHLFFHSQNSPLQYAKTETVSVGCMMKAQKWALKECVTKSLYLIFSTSEKTWFGLPFMTFLTAKPYIDAMQCCSMPRTLESLTVRITDSN